MITKILAVCALVAACGTDPLPAGAVCKQSPDCASGLSCLDVAMFTGTTCTVIAKACSKTCTGDGDCASLGASFKCFAGCGADKTCGATAGP